MRSEPWGTPPHTDTEISDFSFHLGRFISWEWIFLMLIHWSFTLVKYLSIGVQFASMSVFVLCVSLVFWKNIKKTLMCNFLMCIYLVYISKRLVFGGIKVLGQKNKGNIYFRAYRQINIIYYSKAYWKDLGDLGRSWGQETFWSRR